MARAKSQPKRSSARPVSTEISLPVVKKTTIRPSKSGKRRAVVLILVQLFIAVHIAHWLTTGSTMTPLEPSEAMEFSKHSIVNAGLIFFALTILSTLVLGRWFCGWACHLVALQDLCRWILGKFKLRPKPVRLGIFAVVPLIAFMYMFIAPLIYRVWHGHDMGLGPAELTTTTFWATFPSWIPGILTFLSCGFVIVYLLGAKSFCTYGCPYGAIFGIADQLAVGSIRVTDACEGCGHCTAVCSSNVRVHQEVRDYGMVVDPGCMKCLDCVSVCPNDALYFGMGVPSMLAKLRTKRRASGISATRLAAALVPWLFIGGFMFAAYSLFMWFDGDLDWRLSSVLAGSSMVLAVTFKGKSERLRDYSLPEQVFICAVFLLAILVFRGLYGMVPFLFSLGLAAIVSYLAIHLLRIVYKRDLALHRWRLKRGGRLQRAGVVFGAAMLLFLVFSAHSGLVQYHVGLGQHYYRQAARLVAAPDGHQAPDASDDESRTVAVDRALQHIGRAHELSLLPNPYDRLMIARLHLLKGQDHEYETHMIRAVSDLAEDYSVPFELGDYFLSRDRLAEAIDMYERSIQRNPDHVDAYVRLGRCAVGLGRVDDARQAFETALEKGPQDPRVHFNLGVLESMLGHADRAIALFERAVHLDPEFVEARENLAGMYCQTGRFQEGIAHFNEALKTRPNDPETHELIARAYIALEQWPQAESHLRRALEITPNRPTTWQLLNELEARRTGLEDVPVEEEVFENILNQAVGTHTLGVFNLPDPFVRRAADRIIRSTYRQRYRQVVPDEPGSPSHSTTIANASRTVPEGFIRIHRPEVPQATRDYRQSVLEDRPALRGFSAPILDHADQRWSMGSPPAKTPIELQQAAAIIANRLAIDGVLATAVRAIEIVGPNRLLATQDGGEAILRSVGLPVDLLAFFPVGDAASGKIGGGGRDAASVLHALARRLAQGEAADLVTRDLDRVPFRFIKSRADFAVATEDGREDIATLRLQLTRGTYWRGPDAGGCLDVVGQLIASLPEVNVIGSIQQKHLETLLLTARDWPLARPAQLTLIPEPLVVSQWAQDNGKAGYVLDGQLRPATIVPRYASRREDGSVFVPNESFLIDGLASTGHPVVHSPLIFQGGNLMAVHDPATGQRVLLVGEAEIYRNTALGLTTPQVTEAFRLEFDVDRCVVLPAVSFHIDYDVCVRAHQGRVIAFVNDHEAAVEIILALGIDALEAHGTLDPDRARAARDELRAGRTAEFLNIVHGRVFGEVVPGGHFPLSLANHFATSGVDSPVGNFQRFLVALDILASAAIDPAQMPDRHARGYFDSLKRRRADREALHEQLSGLGWEVVPVPSLADAELSLNHVNGIHDRTRYVMPAYGGFFAPLDEAAAAAFQRELGDGIEIIPVLCAESQRRVGAIHCSVAVYRRPGQVGSELE